MIKERESFLKLRADAIERGDFELAITYGWTAIRMGEEKMHQNERSELEKALPQYQRDALDRARAELARDALEHPAIMAALVRIENACGEILRHLKSHPPANVE